MLLQGVVDCCFETLEGITVVDFKTDRVDRRSVAARAEEYRPQPRGSVQPGAGGDRPEAGDPPVPVVFRPGSGGGCVKGRWQLEKFLEKTVAIPVFLCYTILAFIRRGGLLRRLIQNEKEVNTP
mgnify:CR=1 FL=1